CAICGGIPPSEIKIRKILVDNIEVGIDNLEWILEEVRQLNLEDEPAIAEEMLKRVRQFNYVPSRKRDAYAEALLKEYRRYRQEHN
ncbi:MAG TPA: NAC family transcription factor, partial [Methanomicrobiales archaeon]|nr:NAC family transcription factor [Methanomicrobiales archaeon]